MADTTKTIIDLDLRCLQNIAMNLRLKDIINIAEAFNITNINVLKLENSSSNENPKKMRFDKFVKNIQKIFVDMNGGEWYIDNENCVPLTMKLFRHFGCLISNLTVDYGEISDQMSMSIDDAILNNCCESLNRLALSDVNENTLSKIRRPFPNVRALHIYSGYLGKRLSKLYRWFPKLLELDFEQVFFERPDCIEHHFPHLTVLGISNGNVADLPCITDSNVKVALQLNPQVKRLELRDDVGGRDDFGICLSQKCLFFVQRKLPNLRHLNLSISHLDYESTYHHGLLNFEYLETLTLSVKKWSYLTNIQISSNRLEKLTLESEESCQSVEFHQVYELISTFIKNNNNINYLFVKSIHNDYDLYGKHVTGLINDLWNLDEFNIEYDWQGAMAADAIIHFLINSKETIKFTVHWNADRLNKPGAEVKQQFMDSFNNCAQIYMFDTTSWDIDFGYYWNSTYVSFSKQS